MTAPGHRQWLDLGRRTSPTASVRKTVILRNHKQWSDPCVPKVADETIQF